MATASIPVDLFNPGQVFACLGLVELAELLVGEAHAAFDWSDPAENRFVLRTEGAANPIAEGLAFLAEAEVEALAPPQPSFDTAKWGIPCRSVDWGSTFPMPPPSSPASLPAVLVGRGQSIALSSWGEARSGTGRDNVKFWAGMGGYPGVALLRDALSLVRDRIHTAVPNPFSLAAPQRSSLGFDWRRDYVALDIGFSLNQHARITPRGFPLVELLAAIGISHARPRRLTKFKYQYAAAGYGDGEARPTEGLLPAPFLRAALGGASLPFQIRVFTMHLAASGKDDRCITTVHEEIRDDGRYLER